MSILNGQDTVVGSVALEAMESARRAHMLRLETAHTRAVASMPEELEPTSVTVQLDKLLFADIEINSLRQQVVEKDIELLNIRLSQLKAQQDVLWGAVQKVSGKERVTSVKLVDPEKRLVEVE